MYKTQTLIGIGPMGAYKVCDKIYFAKDEGAYIVGFKNGKRLAINYFDGCNPMKDSHHHEETRKIFGGDDFSDDITEMFEGLNFEKLTEIVYDPETETLEFRQYNR